jgi:hypothetical protein
MNTRTNEEVTVTMTVTLSTYQTLMEILFDAGMQALDRWEEAETAITSAMTWSNCKRASDALCEVTKHLEPWMTPPMTVDLSQTFSFRNHNS